jgi:hypothetical protein
MYACEEVSLVARSGIEFALAAIGRKELLLSRANQTKLTKTQKKKRQTHRRRLA